ncbi:hypothetical protein GLA29479_3821 [Lysobacter antibioticus]|uniref:Uncharacterized protein n=1 Tax=Lysobacter antibioticus TaxID=84531 RepID=A0A0S2E1F1_LYSAN|nr:hypothetical protein GLA29479_3821 [Lysobacter antibioticus]ALN82852.1 hypothetical protein LA76x_4749 [Lysobacter antibioticus]
MTIVQRPVTQGQSRSVGGRFRTHGARLRSGRSPLCAAP